VLGAAVVLGAALDAALLLAPAEASTAFAFPQMLSGPLLARNATMMFSPDRP